MVVKRIWLIPVSASLCGFTAVITSYSVGVSLGHFPKILPFISETANLPPEGCLFSQLLNTGAFFILLTCYLRHRQTIEYYGHRLHWEDSKWRTISLLCMWTGIVTAIGLSFVACFPDSEVHTVNQLAATFTFSTALIYGWGQVLIGFCMIPRMASNLVNYSRLLLSIIATTFIFLYKFAVTFRLFSSMDGTNRLVGAASEWIGVTAILLIFLSFAAELRASYAHVPRVVFRRTSTDHNNERTIDVASTSRVQTYW